MPRYYSASSESLSEVACSVTCCCIWMVCVVFTIVPGFLLVLIGCPCRNESALNDTGDICIDCAIIGDILLSIGGSVMLVGFLYYCFNNLFLKKASEANARRRHVNRVPKITITPSVSFNQSCQMQTNEATGNAEYPRIFRPQSIAQQSSKELKSEEKRPRMVTVELEADQTVTAPSDFKRKEVQTEPRVSLEGSLVEGGSHMSSLFSDTMLSVYDERNSTSETV